MNTPEHSQPAVYNDRKAGLIFFGILHILAGFLVLLCCAAMLFGMAIVAATPAADTNAALLSKTIPVAALVCLAIVVWCFWMGIGSMLARRWARALILLMAWFWLVGGIIALITMSFILPALDTTQGMSSPSQQEFTAFLKPLIIGFTAVLYLFLPACLILFYRSSHVKATCEVYDPVERWTDRHPLPRLAIVFAAIMWGANLLFTGTFNWFTPFFGTVVSGVPGAALVLAMLPVLGYIAWGALRCRISAWWCALGFAVLWCVSLAITFLCVPMPVYYEKIGLPSSSIKLLSKNPALMSPGLLYGALIWAVVAIAFLLYARRFFTSAPQAPCASPTQRIP